VILESGIVFQRFDIALGEILHSAPKPAPAFGLTPPSPAILMIGILGVGQKKEHKEQSPQLAEIPTPPTTSVIKHNIRNYTGRDYTGRTSISNLAPVTGHTPSVSWISIGNAAVRKPR
jgi:hypothetical protein